MTDTQAVAVEQIAAKAASAWIVEAKRDGLIRGIANPADHPTKQVFIRLALASHALGKAEQREADAREHYDSIVAWRTAFDEMHARAMRAEAAIRGEAA